MTRDICGIGTTLTLVKRLRGCVVMLAAGAATLAAADGARASVLNFTLVGADIDIQSDTVSNGAGDLLHDYGSATGAAVSSYNTPNVAVEWGLTLTPPDYRWTNPGFAGTGGGMAFYVPATGTATLPSSPATFTGSGFYVFLNSVAAKNFDSVARDVTVRINVDGIDTDFTENVAAGATDTINLTTAGAGSAVKFTFQFTTSSFGPGAWGFDDLTFSQVAVPEPASVALLGFSGLIALGRRARK